MSIWLRNIAFLLLIACSLGGFGFLSGDLYQLLSALSFVLFLATFASDIALLRRIPVRALSLACAAVIIALLVSHLPALGLCYGYFALFAVFSILLRMERAGGSSDFFSYAIAFSIAILCAALSRILPILWHHHMACARTLSHIAEILAREERNLGPTAMGLPLLWALLTLTTVRELMAEERRILRWLGHLILLGLAHLFYLVSLTWYARMIANLPPAFEWMLLNSQHLFLLIGASAFTLLDRRRVMRRDTGVPLRWPVGAAALSLLLGVIVTTALGRITLPAMERPRVMIYDAGYLNWVVPVHGSYGEHSAGMFGLLPSTLESSGFEVVVSDDLDRLSGDNPPGCIIMINIQEFFDAETKQCIWDYIERGGGLLCLGDHTGVAGIRGPFNDLLEPAGISLLFDSATFFGSGWSEALELANHPLTAGFDNAEDYQIWVGASLRVDRRARPVILARYGYSDWGDPSNIRRSYLGDRKYNPDELLGDLVLAASATYGKGKILVFGDTSGYQNFSLAHSLDSVARSLHYLAGGVERMPAARVQTAIIVLLSIVLLAAALSRSSLSVFLFCAAGTGIGFSVIALITPPMEPIVPAFRSETSHAASSPISFLQRDISIIDASHGGRFTLDAWEANSIGGLQLNLLRSGTFPLIRNSFSCSELDRVQFLIIMAPTRNYSRGEIACIDRFLSNGGSALITVGFEEYDGAKDLLNHFGFSLGNMPLGRFAMPWQADSLGIDIHEGWPVHLAHEIAPTLIFSKWDMPVVVQRPVGRGELTVIGDSSFLYDANLETLDTYFPGNIAFIDHLIRRGRDR